MTTDLANSAPAVQTSQASHAKDPLSVLVIGAIGVVFGDIGTSPLYALKECFNPEHGMPFSEMAVYGILSLLFWAMTIVVSVKYVLFIMRANNRGEGGILALLALATQRTGANPRRARILLMLGMFGAAMFYGDSIITPAISVLSAVEGLKIASPGLAHYVLPLSLLILLVLFFIQQFGTHHVGRLFGPITIVWFLMLAIIGIFQISANPAILLALSPYYAIQMIVIDPGATFLVLGSVFLVLTGGEALYADMGHFGIKPIRIGWFFLVMPALVLNYFGQGALILHNPDALRNPFYLSVPAWGALPLVILATMATVIASQAVISGAFSLTSQAIKLGYAPRMKILHTSAREIGQIYIPFINWVLFISVVFLVLGFKTSDNLASAYGIAVSSTMTITTILAFVVAWRLWGWNPWITGLVIGAVLSIDLLFLASNATKFADGGWFPLLVGGICFTLLVTWKRGRFILFENLEKDGLELEPFIKRLIARPPHRIPGSAIFMTSNPHAVPHALLHNLKHNKVLHERVVFLTVATCDVPTVPYAERIKVSELGQGFHRIEANYGFKDEPNIQEILDLCREFHGMTFNMMDTSFFLARETIVPSKIPGMALWREWIFAWMYRNATPATAYFRIPPGRVVELGSQIEI